MGEEGQQSLRFCNRDRKINMGVCSGAREVHSLYWCIFFPASPSGSENWGSLKESWPLWQLKVLLGVCEEALLLLAED